jgi:hypothetical protein
MTTAAPPLRTASPKPHPGAGGLWYALLAPPAAWAAQELLGWFFGERTCGELAPATVRWIVFGMSVLALAVALVGVSLGWRMWQTRDHTSDPLASEHRDRISFMAFGGFLVSTIFAIAIVWAGLSSAFLSDCGRMR